MKDFQRLLRAIENGPPHEAVRAVKVIARWKIYSIVARRALVGAIGSPHRGVRLAAAWAMQVVGDPVPDFTAALEKASRDADDRVREMAVDRMWGDDWAVPPDAALEATSDPSARVREAAIRRLGRHSLSPRGREVLLRATSDTSEAVRRAAVLALASDRGGRKEAVPRLKVLLESDTGPVRACVAWAFLGLGEQCALAPLSSLVRDGEPATLACLVRLLDEEGIRGRVVIPALFEMLRAPHRKLRHRAALALCWRRMDAGEALPRLLQAADDPDEEMRLYVIHALGTLGRRGSAAADRIQAMLTTETPRNRVQCAWALAQLMEADPGSSAAEVALREALRHEDLQVRCAAIDALPTVVRDRRRLAALLAKCARDAEPLVRASVWEATRSLAEDSEGVVPLIFAGLEDAHPDVRVRAAENANSECVWSVPVLLALVRKLEDSDEEMRQAATGGIGGAIRSRLTRAELGRGEFTAERVPLPDELRPVLDALPPRLGDEDEDVRALAIDAIRRFVEAFEVSASLLLPAFRHPDLETREAAAYAATELGALAAPLEEAMVALAGDADRAVHLQALAGLSRLSSPGAGALAALARGLADSDAGIREYSADCLVHLGEKAASLLPALAEQLRSATGNDAMRIAEVLVALGADPALTLPHLAGERVHERTGKAPCHHPSPSFPRSSLLRHRDLVNDGLLMVQNQDWEDMRHAAEESSNVEGGDVRERMRAVFGLGMLVPDAGLAAAGLAKGLEDPSAAVRAEAARALPSFVMMRDAPLSVELTRALVTALQDSNAGVRWQCALALGRATKERETCLSGLRAALEDPDLRVRVQAAESLTDLGASTARSTEVLIEGVVGGGEHERVCATRALGSVAAAPPDLRAVLEKAMTDADRMVRFEAARTMAHFGWTSPSVVAVLRADLQSPIDGDRARIIQRIGEVRPMPAELMAILEETLSDRDPSLRTLAACRIADAGGVLSPAVAGVLVAAVSRGVGGEPTSPMGAAWWQPQPARDSAMALCGLRPLTDEAVKALQDAAQRGGRELRVAAALALAHGGREADLAVPILVEALGEREGCLRASVALALGRLRHTARRAAPVLERLLEDSDVNTRLYSAIALAMMGSLPADRSSLLDEALHHPDPVLRAWAAAASKPPRS